MNLYGVYESKCNYLNNKQIIPYVYEDSVILNSMNCKNNFQIFLSFISPPYLFQFCVFSCHYLLCRKSLSSAYSSCSLQSCIRFSHPSQLQCLLKSIKLSVIMQFNQKEDLKFSMSVFFLYLHEKNWNSFCS